jgi:hypothetical protein
VYEAIINTTVMKDVTLYLFHAECLWFETYDKPFNEEEEAVISGNFDYDNLFDGTKRVYFDIGLKYNNAGILYRIGIEFDGREIPWSEVFNFDFIYKMTNRAIELCNEEYCGICDERNISCTYVSDINASIPTLLANETIKQYLEYRSVFDQQNEYLINNVGLECESGTDSEALLKCTFLILDEILIKNPSFNKERNQDSFDDIIPMPKYYTLRYNCLRIEHQDVQLSFYDGILFYHCLDCALQMLIGDRSDIIISALESNGIDNEMQHTYIKSGTDLFTQLHEMLKNSNARILNLEKHIDWNSIIH